MHRDILSAVPLPPTNLVASEVTSDSVTLTWSSENAEPVQSYIIQYKEEYSSDEYSSIAGVMTTQYKVSLLKANTAYEFRIVAVNDAGQSQPSLPLHVITSKGRLIRLAECNKSTLHIILLEYCKYFTVGKSDVTHIAKSSVKLEITWNVCLIPSNSFLLFGGFLRLCQFW